MVTIIKKGTTKKNLTRLLQKIKSKKGFDAYKFCGAIKLGKDPLVIQKEMRNEWH